MVVSSSRTQHRRSGHINGYTIKNVAAESLFFHDKAEIDQSNSRVCYEQK